MMTMQIRLLIFLMAVTAMVVISCADEDPSTSAGQADNDDADSEDNDDAADNENGTDEDMADWPELEALGDYPRPDRVRQNAMLLTGQWQFAYDSNDAGLNEQWQLSPDFPLMIQVPFAVESEASGIHDTNPPAVVWYSKAFSWESKDGAPALLHFGAADYHAMVWLNGIFLGEHFGGYTPFSFEVGDLLQAENHLVVRIEDSLSLVRPRGKQSWTGEPFLVFYETATGIWQPVWIEKTGPVYLERFRLRGDGADGRVTFHMLLAGDVGQVSIKAIAVSPSGETKVTVKSVTKTKAKQEVVLTMSLSERALWSPEDPNLYSLRFVIIFDGMKDVVDTYFGLRTIEIIDDDIFLNGEYRYQKLVLNQGYYDQGDYTPLDADQYRQDIEIIKEYGFNGFRMHEKIESPQLLFWADYLGALVWEELPSAWYYSDAMAANLNREWKEAILRDVNHPSIITWVPMNESWGVGTLLLPMLLLPEPKQYVKDLYSMTRQWDPTRIVIDNSGYDHTSVTDVVDVHHYVDSLEKAARIYDELRYDLYDYKWSIGRILRYGNNIFAPDEGYSGQPILISEYGGFGYYDSENPGDLLEKYRAYTEQIQAQPHIDGYCYTQFTDVFQEKNGLLDITRNPKVSADRIREINESD